MLINEAWDVLLEEEYKKDYFTKLINFLEEEYKKEVIYPDKNYIFRAFKCVDPKNVKVVILGQDPYHGEGEAEGLAFSVPDGIKMPPSLRNIYKELKEDLNIERDTTSLIDWANQGVFLLNTILTVKKDTPLSHEKIGWDKFTDEVIKIIDKNNTNTVFILWGNNARKKKDLIKNNFVIESAHPSPLSASRGFFGSKPFSKTNEYLKKNKIDEIRW